MCMVIVFILLTFFAHAHDKDSRDKLADKLVDKLLDRSLQAWPLHDAGLEKTTLAKTVPPKTHLAKSYGTPYTRPHFPLSYSAFPVPRFPLRSTTAQGMDPVRSQQVTKTSMASDDAKAEAAATTALDQGIDWLALTGWPKSFSEVGRLWLGQSEIPVAQYKIPDVKELFGGALFLVLERFKDQKGPAYLLPTGLTSSFLVLSDPASAKHVLNSYSKYEKGLVREISQFLFGDGFAVADGKPWLIRRRAVYPSLHKKFLSALVNSVFFNCSLRTVDVLASQSQPGKVVNMEKIFSELTLDIIGKAVFNYDFKSVGQEGDNRIVDAVYTALKETEARSLDLTPLWKLPGDLPYMISPRQRRAMDAVATIRKTTEDLIENCRQQMESEEAAGTNSNDEDQQSEADPSVLRFLIATREKVTSKQLRDDLLSMLVAGHETTASVLTWTLYLLTKHPDKMARVQEEIDVVLGDKIKAGSNGFLNLTMGELLSANYLRWCVAESMRLYPHPPVLIRRALEDDYLPNGWKVPKGQDVMISIYNIHHSATAWSDPNEFIPERWSAYTEPRQNPNEGNTDFRYIPFSAGPRKCIGDQFALIEAYTAMSVLLHKFDFQLVKDQDIRMTTGATIHTTNGMKMTYTPRN